MLLEYSLRGEATLRRGITVNLVVQGRNLDITDALTDHAEQKLRRLVKYLSEEARCDLELSVEKNPSIAEDQIAEATIYTKGPVIRGVKPLQTCTLLLICWWTSWRDRSRSIGRRWSRELGGHAVPPSWSRDSRCQRSMKRRLSLIHISEPTRLRRI